MVSEIVYLDYMQHIAMPLESIARLYSRNIHPTFPQSDTEMRGWRSIQRVHLLCRGKPAIIGIQFPFAGINDIPSKLGGVKNGRSNTYAIAVFKLRYESNNPSAF